ncbi:F-box protein [Abeliophyllum distichum]|uniref:F-box protein n=1 Tax=Abeliophyllum distichum TaxID=126358 RepID=A0ABD1SD01_9LAMI
MFFPTPPHPTPPHPRGAQAPVWRCVPEQPSWTYRRAKRTRPRLQDSYGVKQNIGEGCRFLVQANARELATVLAATPSAALASDSWLTWNPIQYHPHLIGAGCLLLSDFGCNIPAPEPPPVNRFLFDWFSIRGGNLCLGLRLCSHAGCGRPETRWHEFRRCSTCGAVNYCSRACQALDWKLRHKVECALVERWAEEEAENEPNINGGGDDGNGNGNGNGNGDEAMGWGRTLI